MIQRAIKGVGSPSRAGSQMQYKPRRVTTFGELSTRTRMFPLLLLAGGDPCRKLRRFPLAPVISARASGSGEKHLPLRLALPGLPGDCFCPEALFLERSIPSVHFYWALAFAQLFDAIPPLGSCRKMLFSAKKIACCHFAPLAMHKWPSWQLAGAIREAKPQRRSRDWQRLQHRVSDWTDFDR